MRLRHITGSEDYVAQSEYVVHEPEKNKGQWKQFFGNGHPIHVEIGMGKGQFIEQMALTHPDINYIGIERYDTVMLKALKKREALMAEGAALQNLTFISIDARLLADVFETGEIDRIYLNFSDPWQKKGYAKRRLTYRDYLSLYFTLLCDGGSLTFKTDNLPLFEFTLSECAQVGLTPDIVTYDLHSSPYAEGNVMTEYERNFTDQGMKINMLRVTKPAGYVPPVPEDVFGAKRRRSEIEKKRETAEKG